MNNFRIGLVITIQILILITACTKVVPASFWNNFQEDLLKKNINRHGPWGGHRAMFWKADSPNAFTSDQIIHFATENGWQWQSLLPSMAIVNRYSQCVPTT